VPDRAATLGAVSTGRVTLQTIADRVGVSRMTVSNAFSRPDQLSEAMRERILGVARELGYAGPDPAARALVRGTAGAVGVLLTSALSYAFTDDVGIAFMAAVTDELAPTGLAITLLSSETRHDVVPARDAALDAAIVYSCDPDSTALDMLVARRVPLVYVDQQPVAGVPSVNVDDRAGARLAAQHVLDLGHRRVLVMTAALGGGTGLVEDPEAAAAQWKLVSRERMLGFLDALRAAGVDPVVHKQHHSDDDAAHEAALELLAGEERPTAVLCFSDMIALGVVRAAEELGLDVPGDLSVVGYDDSPLSRGMRPALTTVHQDHEAKGRLAAAALARALADPDADPERHLLPTTLVARESTAPVAG
jgi:DNA-binding LacI/PurR family transcriptional regulator